MNNVLSGVPARLEYACGHHALVSLQAVKGESGLQRRQRIEREKAAALARACDFCGPVLASSDEAVEAIGTMMEVAATPEDVVAAAEAIAEEAAEFELLSDQNGALSTVEILAPVETVEELVADVVEDVFEDVLAEAIVEEAVEAPVRTRAAVRKKPQRQRAKATPVRFRVDFVGVREVRADDISAAVAQAEAMGLREIIAITRLG